jgi:hypothetical protein
MESKVLRALNVAERELQLVLPAMFARSADLAEEFANLNQDISYEESIESSKFSAKS